MAQMDPREIGQHDDDAYAASEEESKELEKHMRLVLRVLEHYHPGTHLSWIGGPVNPEHPCRFRSNPEALPGDPETEVLFTCQVQHDKLVAIVPLRSPFVRRAHHNAERDLALYRRCLMCVVPPGKTMIKDTDIDFQTDSGEEIVIKLTYEVSRRDNITRRECVLQANTCVEFAELLDCFLGTEICPRVEHRFEHPELYVPQTRVPKRRRQ
jgi:hypothetical protein